MGNGDKMFAMPDEANMQSLTASCGDDYMSRDDIEEVDEMRVRCLI